MSTPRFQLRAVTAEWSPKHSTEPIALTSALKSKIDREWDQSLIRFAGRIFDGPTLVLHESTKRVAQATYRLTLALQSPVLQSHPELKGWRALAVSGVVETPSGFIFGRRGTVSQGAETWELIPSGGLEPRFLHGQEVDFKGQFLEELKEESGIGEASVKSAEAVGLLLEDEHSIDVVFRAKIDALPVLQPNHEYSAFQIVAPSQLDEFVRAYPILPATLAILKWLNLLPQGSYG